MRTLLLESSPGAGAAAESALRRAGVEPLRCNDAVASSFPCRELLDPGSCPLSGASRPDVVLVARTANDPGITPGEAGVTCALRHGVPVVVDRVGAGVANPFGDLVSVIAGEDRVAACEEAIAAAQDRDAGPLVAEVIRLLDRSGATDHAVRVSVVREGAKAQILVKIPVDADVSDEAIAVRVHGCYRQLHGDGRPSLIEVGVRRVEGRPEERR